MNDEKIDRATAFSIQYLDLLEDILKIEYSDNKTPIFVPNRINTKDINHLKKSINDLHISKIKDDAITDMHFYSSKKPYKTQTTAVGYASDFHMLVKLGLLLGERLVLWDTVLISLIFHQNLNINLISLGKVANSLLQFRSIVDDGGLIILPQPKTWLPRAKSYFDKIPDQISSNNIFKGFVNASALLKEGFVLHPYVLQHYDDYNKAIMNLRVSQSQYYSSKKADYHLALQKVLKNKDFVFLNEINAAEFYHAINSLGSYTLKKLQKKLAEKLSFPNNGLSNVEKEIWIDEVINELKELLPSVDKLTLNHKIQTNLSGMSALKATFSICADSTSAGLFSILFSGIGAIGSLGSYLKTVFTPPQDATNISNVYKTQISCRKTVYYRN